MSLAKSDMEDMAHQLRSNLNLSDENPLDPFKIKIQDVYVLSLDEVEGLPTAILRHLKEQSWRAWSAMSVPLDPQQEKWAIIYNDRHDLERRRVSLLEEFWHIFQGHRLTTVVKVGSMFGRSFEQDEEHDAYYLASATLLPKTAIYKAVEEKKSAGEIARNFGVSKELVEYRIKRLGLWNLHKGRSISLSS